MENHSRINVQRSRQKFGFLDIKSFISCKSKLINMATKFLGEHKGNSYENLVQNRVMYTGTCKKYLYNILRNKSQFRHYFTQPIYLTNYPFTAMGFARKRSLFYRDSPLVLAVDTEKLEGEIYYDLANYKTKALNIGSFLIYEFSLGKERRIKEKDCYDILTLEDKVIKTSYEEIRKKINKFLSVESD